MGDTTVDFRETTDAGLTLRARVFEITRRACGHYVDKICNIVRLGGVPARNCGVKPDELKKLYLAELCTPCIEFRSRNCNRTIPTRKTRAISVTLIGAVSAEEIGHSRHVRHAVGASAVIALNN